jgi:hypothetical protein
VLDALNMAIGQRRPREVIHHSDQGSQYTSIAFGVRCREAGVRPSMGSVGDAYDNAMCESFFATLECELLQRRKFQTKAEARMAVFVFIEGWYNPGRQHSALGYRSSVEFERYAPRCAFTRKPVAVHRTGGTPTPTPVQGVSTRSVDDLVKALGMSGISKSRVSRLCAEIDERVAAFLDRPLEGDWPYLWRSCPLAWCSWPSPATPRQGTRPMALRPDGSERGVGSAAIRARGWRRAS